MVIFSSVQNLHCFLLGPLKNLPLGLAPLPPGPSDLEPPLSPPLSPPLESPLDSPLDSYLFSITLLLYIGARFIPLARRPRSFSRGSILDFQYFVTTALYFAVTRHLRANDEVTVCQMSFILNFQQTVKTGACLLPIRRRLRLQ